RNPKPLLENYIVGQLRYAMKKDKTPLPPNCSNQAYYKGFGVCKPDSHCATLKNPVNYPFRVLGQKKGIKGRKGKSKG
ncbi:MAG: hypothetical protein ACE5FW_03230, partial [Candidatus Aenigmatarchaeota archaeon]